jgi:molybdopterin converting factor small subunit
MPRLELTSHFQRHVPCSGLTVESCSLRAALEELFQEFPRLRSYVLDDQGRVRPHVAIFVDQQLLRDRTNWDRPLAPESRVYILQALSGG